MVERILFPDLLNPYEQLTPQQVNIEGGIFPFPIYTAINILPIVKEEELKIEELSPSLEKALDHFQMSWLVKETLPESLYNKFIENKKIEYSNFNQAVTDYEIKNYFGSL